MSNNKYKSNRELTEEELEMFRRFFAWTPDQVDCSKRFRCLIHPARIVTTDRVCMNRATKQDVFSDTCSTECPRWNFYVDLANRSDDLQRRAYCAEV